MVLLVFVVVRFCPIKRDKKCHSIFGARKFFESIINWVKSIRSLFYFCSVLLSFLIKIPDKEFLDWGSSTTDHFISYTKNLSKVEKKKYISLFYRSLAVKMKLRWEYCLFCHEMAWYLLLVFFTLGVGT